MREAEFGQIVGDDTFRTRHCKALADYPDQIYATPANNAIGFPVRTGFDNMSQFSHLLIAQQAPSPGTLAVGQSIRAILVEAMHPIIQRLTLSVWQSIPPIRAASVRFMPS